MHRPTTILICLLSLVPSSCAWSQEFESAPLALALAAGIPGVVGDGVADDTAALQAYLDQSRGGIAFIPPGRYRLTDALVLEDVHVIGGNQGPSVFSDGTMLVLNPSGTATASNVALPPNTEPSSPQIAFIVRGSVTMEDLTLAVLGSAVQTATSISSPIAPEEFERARQTAYHDLEEAAHSPTTLAATSTVLTFDPVHMAFAPGGRPGTSDRAVDVALTLEHIVMTAPVLTFLDDRRAGVRIDLTLHDSQVIAQRGLRLGPNPGRVSVRGLKMFADTVWRDALVRLADPDPVALPNDQSVLTPSRRISYSPSGK